MTFAIVRLLNLAESRNRRSRLDLEGSDVAFGGGFE